MLIHNMGMATHRTDYSPSTMNIWQVVKLFEAGMFQCDDSDDKFYPF